MNKMTNLNIDISNQDINKSKLFSLENKNKSNRAVLGRGRES